MKKYFILTISMMVLTACSGKLSHNSAADKSANGALCGTEQISFNDAANWQCLDNSHFLCSKPDGCLKDGILYPLWSYFGDNSNSFDSVIPPQPEHPQGYHLEFKDDNYLWTCTEDSCVCGRGMIEKGQSCEKETFHAQVNQDCGQEVCKIDKNGVCKDGKCWCGDTWQGTDGDKYDCREYYGGSVYYEGFKYYGEFGDNTIENKLTGAECTYYPGFCETTIEAFNKINDKKYHYKCLSKEGCACGDETCIEGSECSLNHCYCGEIALSGFKNADNYSCKNNKMICQSPDGCLCGDHKVVHGAECMNNKQYCHSSECGWIDEAMVSQYECDENYPMIVCTEENGCKCGDHTCVRGASCIDNKCVCGNHFEDPNDIILKNISQYECTEGEYVCAQQKGCTCGKESCIYGSKCNDKTGCSCADFNTNLNKSNYNGYSCIHDYLVCYEGNCQCPPGANNAKSDDDDDDDNYYGTDESWVCDREDGRSYGPYYSEHPYVDGLAEDKEDSKIINNTRITDSVFCTDCADFTELTYAPVEVIRKSFECRKNGGCYSHGQYFEFGDILKYWDIYFSESEIKKDGLSQGILYQGYPIKDIVTFEDKGIRVAICNHTKPLSVLKSELQAGKIKSIGNTWICDSDQCLCGSQNCQPGDLCQDGKCSPYQGCVPGKGAGIVNYCYDKNQTPEIRPLDDRGYVCGSSSSTQRHWYCNDKKGCQCNGIMCPESAYCLDGQCICDGQPLKSGYTCSNGKQIADNSNPLCGDEPLKKDYICSNEHQLCNNKSGCMCGNTQIPANAICDHDSYICPLDSSHAGCLCGNQILPSGYKCSGTELLADRHTVCNQKDCACGNSTCHAGDICDNGKCLCGDPDNINCLCGSEILKDKNYTCWGGNLICNNTPDGKPDFYKIAYKNTYHYPSNSATCNCGDQKIGFGSICKDKHECTDCPHIGFAVKDSDDYYQISCPVNDKIINISYKYHYDSYNFNSDVYYFNNAAGELQYFQDGANFSDYPDHLRVYDKIDPCECIHDKNAPKTEKELSIKYCLIDSKVSRYNYEKEYEIVEGWHYKEFECEDANEIELAVNPETGRCVCGKHELSLEDTQNYYCDNHVAWRCFNDEGCACGDTKCSKSQICLKPGVCSLQ